MEGRILIVSAMNFIVTYMLCSNCDACSGKTPTYFQNGFLPIFKAFSKTFNCA